MLLNVSSPSKLKIKRYAEMYLGLPQCLRRNSTHCDTSQRLSETEYDRKDTRQVNLRLVSLTSDK